MKQISVGDKFPLCGVKWRVEGIRIDDQTFTAGWQGGAGIFPLSGADSLDWIEPESVPPDLDISIHDMYADIRKQERDRTLAEVAEMVEKTISDVADRRSPALSPVETCRIILNRLEEMK